MNDNQNTDMQSVEPVISDEEIERRLKLIRHQVAMLMDELKSLFIPGMKLTFIARNPADTDNYTLLTEETDMDALVEAIKNMKKPENIETREAGNA